MYFNKNLLFFNFSDNLKIDFCDGAYALCDEKWHDTNVCSPFSRLYYIIDGEGVLEYEEKKIRMKAGNMYFIPLGLRFSYSCAERLEKLFFHLNISIPGINDLFYGCQKIASIKSDNINEIYRLYLSSRGDDMLRLLNMIRSDVLKFIFIPDMGVTIPEPYCRTVSNAMYYINRNLSVKLNIKSVADALFISESKLSKEFRRETGISIGQYIDNRIIFEAEKGLAQPGCSITSLSESLGFCDRFYFSRRFKEKTGKTPSQYRKQIGNTYATETQTT